MRDIYATFVDTKTTTITIRKFSLIEWVRYGKECYNNFDFQP